MHPYVRIGLAAVFVGALVPNHSRQTWLALGFILVLGLNLAGRLSPRVRWVGGPLVAACAVGVLRYRGAEVGNYLLREGDSSTVLTGNGRIELWGYGIRTLDTTFDWTMGHGFGVTRDLFVPHFDWAHSAHSSFLAALVSLGLIGLLILLAVLAQVTVHIVRSRLWATSSRGFCLTLLLVLAVLNGVVSDNLVIPNIGSGLLFLVAAVARVHREVPAAGTPAPDLESTIGPLPGRALAR